MRRRTRILVVDDSPTLRGAIKALLQDQPGMEVVGEAGDGLDAIAQARTLRPDVITMDVLMPRLDGLEAIAQIMAEAPSRILVISSVAEADQVDLSFKAIAAGALELLSKPSVLRAEDLRAWGRKLVESIRLMAEIPVITRRRSPIPAGTHLTHPIREIDVFGLAASTGGPAALAQIFGALPASLPIPLLVAQHMGEGFTPGMIRWLSQVTPLTVSLASNGGPCEAGHIYLPPDGHDLEVDPEQRLRVVRSRGGVCPSGDRLLTSIARAYAARSGGAVLTGMGNDGAQGLLAIQNVGGVTLVQDNQSSVVFAMPQAALNLGATQNVVRLDFIAPLICELSAISARRPYNEK